MVVNTLGLYGHAIPGIGRCYVLDITLYLLQMMGMNNELGIHVYITSYLISCISS